MTTTRACSRAPSGSSAPATAPSSPTWIAALDGVDDKLAAGAHGRRRRLRSRRVGRRPRRRRSRSSHFTGFDFHAPSIETSRERAAEAGVSTADDLRGRRRQELRRHVRPHLLLRLPARHGRPGRHRPLRPRPPRTTAAPSCSSSRSPSTTARRTSTDNPMAALLYTASSAICTPNSLSQEVGLGLGAQAGQARLREVFKDAGFTRFRRAAETPMNLVIEARPYPCPLPAARRSRVDEPLRRPRRATSRPASAGCSTRARRRCGG